MLPGRDLCSNGNVSKPGGVTMQKPFNTQEPAEPDSKAEEQPSRPDELREARSTIWQQQRIAELEKNIQEPAKEKE